MQRFRRFSHWAPHCNPEIGLIMARGLRFSRDQNRKIFVSPLSSKGGLGKFQKQKGMEKMILGRPPKNADLSYFSISLIPWELSGSLETSPTKRIWDRFWNQVCHELVLPLPRIAFWALLHSNYWVSSSQVLHLHWQWRFSISVCCSPLQLQGSSREFSRAQSGSVPATGPFAELYPNLQKLNSSLQIRCRVMLKICVSRKKRFTQHPSWIMRIPEHLCWIIDSKLFKAFF